jgi:hypothetical protein
MAAEQQAGPTLVPSQEWAEALPVHDSSSLQQQQQQQQQQQREHAAAIKVLPACEQVDHHRWEHQQQLNILDVVEACHSGQGAAAAAAAASAAGRHLEQVFSPCGSSSVGSSGAVVVPVTAAAAVCGGSTGVSNECINN